MNDTGAGSVTTVLNVIGASLPLLLLHLAVCITLLVIGVAIYTRVTPFRERVLVQAGNTAAGIVLGSATLALAIPQAALLATSGRLLDIAVWGVIALVLQLLTLAGVSAVLSDLQRMIEHNNVAAAVVVAASQIAVALLTAAVLVPN